jgi:hypothetical protein
MSYRSSQPRQSSILWAMTPLGGFLSRADVPTSDDVYFSVVDPELVDAHNARR